MKSNLRRPTQKSKSSGTGSAMDRVMATKADTEKGYREQALKLYPWVCGRCQRDFNRHNLSELTVHHRDHNHDNNPTDGTNWELLCLYCHDMEHARLTEHAKHGSSALQKDEEPDSATHNPFAQLKAMMEKSNS
uniref:Putative HNH nuclease YajD n=1 Tax=Magnetococcus massalia (strain MO-1) TaxID=451514 RepID=A0A1S7LI66_MAGMO|nr:conserved protein of unknown function [Candidatus Magnetococcus massalia]